MLNAVSYLLAAWTAWQATQSYKVTDEDLVRYEGMAQDIISVTEDPEEKPLFKGDTGIIRTQTLLAAIAFRESNLIERIDKGRCRKNECDGGKAWGIFQIHPGPTGIMFSGPTYRYAKRGSDDVGLKGMDLVTDRTVGVRMALHMARESLTATGTLCIYTGEDCSGPMPKAKHRIDLAKSWVELHPASR